MQYANTDARVAGTEIQQRMATSYQPPTLEVICLACEISAYAPDDDIPLF